MLTYGVCNVDQYFPIMYNIDMKRMCVYRHLLHQVKNVSFYLFLSGKLSWANFSPQRGQTFILITVMSGRRVEHDSCHAVYQQAIPSSPKASSKPFPPLFDVPFKALLTSSYISLILPHALNQR